MLPFLTTTALKVYIHITIKCLTAANIKLKYAADLFQPGLNCKHIFPCSECLGRFSLTHLYLFKPPFYSENIFY